MSPSLNFRPASLTPLAISSPLNTPLSPTIIYDRFGGILATTALSGSLLIDSGAPIVSQTAFNFSGTSQSYTVVFNEDVSASIAASDFELLNLTTNTIVQLVVSHISSDGRTVTLTFANTGGLAENVLMDGDWAVVELRSMATAKNGMRFDNRYCWLCRFEGDRITEVRAYLDSWLVGELFRQNPVSA